MLPFRPCSSPFRLILSLFNPHSLFVRFPLLLCCLALALPPRAQSVLDDSTLSEYSALSGNLNGKPAKAAEPAQLPPPEPAPSPKSVSAPAKTGASSPSAKPASAGKLSGETKSSGNLTPRSVSSAASSSTTGKKTSGSTAAKTGTAPKGASAAGAAPSSPKTSAPQKNSTPAAPKTNTAAVRNIEPVLDLPGTAAEMQQPLFAVLDLESDSIQSEGTGTITQSVWNELQRGNRVRLIPLRDARYTLSTVNLTPTDPYRLPPARIQIARVLRADYLILGSINVFEGSYVLELQLFSAADNRTIRGRNTVSSTGFPGLMKEIPALTAALVEGVPSRVTPVFPRNAAPAVDEYEMVGSGTPREKLLSMELEGMKLENEQLRRRIRDIESGKPKTQAPSREFCIPAEEKPMPPVAGGDKTAVKHKTPGSPAGTKKPVAEMMPTPKPPTAEPVAVETPAPVEKKAPAPGEKKVPARLTEPKTSGVSEGLTPGMSESPRKPASAARLAPTPSPTPRITPSPRPTPVETPAPETPADSFNRPPVKATPIAEETPRPPETPKPPVKPEVKKPETAKAEEPPKVAPVLDAPNAEARRFFEESEKYPTASKEGIAPLEKALNLDPNNVAYQRRLVVRLYESGQYPLAAQRGEAFVKRGSSDVNMNIYVGAAYSQLGKYREALEATNRVLAMEPNNGYAQYNRAMNLQQMGDPKAADAYKSFLKQFGSEPAFADYANKAKESLAKMGGK